MNFARHLYAVLFLLCSQVSWAAVTVYQHCNYTGWSVSLEPGRYTLADLRSRGFVNDDASSIRVPAGYSVELYQDDQYLGRVLTVAGDKNCFVADNFNDIASSIVVKATASSSSSSSSSSVASSSAGVVTTSTQYYTENAVSIANPERGWLVQRFSHDVGTLTDLRSSPEKVSLVLLKIDIGAFKNADHLSAEKLNEVRAALQKCREAGIKVIMRSAYAWVEILAPDPADIQRMVAHINDMRSIYYDNKDVIVAVEMGMFGPWGEMHSSSHSTVNTALYYPIKTDALRIVHQAYMNALPPDRQVLVRRPYYMREVFGHSAPLAASDAYSTSAQARTGYHNDAYLNSADDGGTFAHGWTRQQELEYIHATSQFTFFGGETFGTPNGTYNNATNALYESRYQHMSYLNREYYTPIYDAWGSVKETFTQQLGYRIVMENAVYNPQVAPGGLFNVKLQLRNDGFAALHNPRKVELVFDNGQQQIRAVTSINPRIWQSGIGSLQVARQFHIPANLAQGQWNVFLALPDNEASLRNDARYSVQFANQNTWDTRGWNKLFTVTVTAGAAGDRDTNNEFFEVGGPVPVDPPASIQNSNLKLRYAFAQSVSFYQAYIDADNNSATGFTTAGVGAEYLIENGNLYRNTGAGWSWAFVAVVTFETVNNERVWTIPLSLMDNSVAVGDKVVFAASNGASIVESSQPISIMQR